MRRKRFERNKMLSGAEMESVKIFLTQVDR